MDLERKQEKIFYFIAFGFPFLMTIPMIYGYMTNRELHLFPLSQMLYPALAVMIARRATHGIPKKLLYPYAIGTFSLMIIMVLNLFLNLDIALTIVNTILIVLSIYFLFQVYDISKKDEYEMRINGLGKGSIKEGIKYIFYIFIISYILAIISNMMDGTFDDFIEIIKEPKTIILQLLLPLNFIFTYILFLGEEYGWRYFLQPILQKKYGMRKGLILLGLIWGIWHLPLNFLYYNKIDQGFLSLLNQIIVCIAYGIFFGYVYQKTKSIWIVSFLHFINNNMIAILSGGIDAQKLQEAEFTWTGILFNLVFAAIFYGFFLFKKSIRDENSRMPTLVERIEKAKNIKEPEVLKASE
ncbi:MAG: CPBP family intramembrane metalloprotease [Tissierellia bacterium]|nr:CPBP family intramembrane metalloprotease [Tissierellia bacterium]